MRQGIFLYSAFLTASIAAAPIPAQQSSSSEQPASAAKAPPASETAGPSAETVKKARGLGLKPEMHGGKQQYCWEDASIGSRFPTKKCVDESQLDDVIAQRQALKDSLRQSSSGSSSH